MSILAAAWLAVILTVSGCVDSLANPPSLAGTHWELRGTESQSQPITLSFSSDGRIEGSGGCNRYFGDYRAAPGQQLSVSDLGSTKMLCLGPRMKRETDFLHTLARVTHYHFEPNHLQLRSPDGQLDFTPRHDLQH